MTVLAYGHPVIKAYMERAGSVYDENKTLCSKCYASNGPVRPPDTSFGGKPIVKPTMISVAFHYASNDRCSLRENRDHMHLTCLRCGYEWWRRPKDAVPQEEWRFNSALSWRWPHMLLPSAGHVAATCETCVEGERIAEQAEADFVTWIERLEAEAQA